MPVRELWRRHGLHVSFVAASLAIAGLLSYVYLIVAARQLGPGSFGLLSVVWSLAVAIGAGVFIPVEQETSRAEAAGSNRALRDGRDAGLRVLGILAVVAVVTAPWAIPVLLNGVWGLWVMLLAVAAASALVSPARGVLAARQSFRWYGFVVVLEAAVRAGGALMLGAVGAGSVTSYAFLLPLSTAMAAGLAWIALRRAAAPTSLPNAQADGGQGAGVRPAMQLMWLVLATVSAQALINLPPIVVKATADAALAGQVLALLAIARIPVFLAPALLAPLLPVMVRQHERHETPRVVRLAAALVGSLFGCASAAALMSLLIGDWLVALLFGSDYGLPPINLAILSAATFIFIAALLVTSALVAVRRNSWALASWVIGLLVFAASAVTVRSVPANVEVGLLAGAATAVLVSGCGLVLTARRGDAVWAR